MSQDSKKYIEEAIDNINRLLERKGINFDIKIDKESQLNSDIGFVNFVADVDIKLLEEKFNNIKFMCPKPKVYSVNSWAENIISELHGSLNGLLIKKGIEKNNIKRINEVLNDVQGILIKNKVKNQKLIDEK